MFTKKKNSTVAFRLLWIRVLNMRSRATRHHVSTCRAAILKLKKCRLKKYLEEFHVDLRLIVYTDGLYGYLNSRFAKIDKNCRFGAKKRISVH